MNELYNCIPLDSEAAKRITYFAQLCKKIKVYYVSNRT